jgi:hypothetical protein
MEEDQKDGFTLKTWASGEMIDDAPECKACGNKVGPPRDKNFARLLLYGNSKGEYICGDCLVESVMRTVGVVNVSL